MKVYVALGIYPYEGNALIGVFTSPEKAFEAVEATRGNGLKVKGDYQEVYEIDLNDLCPYPYCWPDPLPREKAGGE